MHDAILFSALGTSNNGTGGVMRKLAKNWEGCLSRVTRATLTHNTDEIVLSSTLVLRRPSEDSTGKI